MNFIDYSKAHFHLANLKDTVERAKQEVNSEDISVEFLYNCMSEKIEKEEKHKKTLEALQTLLFKNGDYTIDTEERTFIIRKKKEGEKVLPVFLTDKNNILIPIDVTKVIRKPYVFLGFFEVNILIRRK